eukprot:scaffold47143_cov18-Tisochrysis_lutea.AAC.1
MKTTIAGLTVLVPQAKSPSSSPKGTLWRHYLHVLMAATLHKTKIQTAETRAQGQQVVKHRSALAQTRHVCNIKDVKAFQCYPWSWIRLH